MAVYCCTSASYSSSTSSLLSSSYGSNGYRNLTPQQQQPKEQHSDNKDLFTPAIATRLLLDIYGQPIVTRSKSMSTGSSLQQPDGSSSSSCNILAVMVPPPLSVHPQCSIPPATKTLESAVKSCVRSFRDRVHPSAKFATTASISCSSQTSGGVDNAGFVESSSGRWPSAMLEHQTTNNNNNSQSTEEPSSSTRSKLANLPVVPCASASTSYSSTSSSTSSQTRRHL